MRKLEQETIQSKFVVIVVVYVNASHKSNVSQFLFQWMYARLMMQAKNMMSRYYICI